MYQVKATDAHYVPSDDDRWQVVIERDGRIVGIPLRGVSEFRAKNAVLSIRYAFEYGLHEARARAAAALQSMQIGVEAE